MGKAPKFVKFKFDALPPSVNKAVRHGKNGSYKSKELKEWNELVGYHPVQTIAKSQWYGVTVKLFFPLFFKNGNIRRRDADDMLKYAIDIPLLRVEDEDLESIDDSRITEGFFYKSNSDEEYCEIIFYTVG